MRLDEARRAAARQLDAVLRDVGRPLGRAPKPQIWLLLVAGAALGFWWGQRRRSG
ncbi:MAG: hypothetical protein ACRD2Z_01040 [Thermoanaerobaculia bacterium]